MPTISCVSHEFLQRTFQYLDPDSYSVHKGDLYNCLQVCRLWHSVALPIVYHRFHIRVNCPAFPNDPFVRQLASPHLSHIKILSISMSSQGQLYISQGECLETILHLTRLINLVSSIQVLRRVDFDLFVFTTSFCEDGLWQSLQPANEAVLRLARELVLRNPDLYLRLGRPELMEERSIEIASRPVMDAILQETKSTITSLFTGCHLPWLLSHLEQILQLSELFYVNVTSPYENQAAHESRLWNIIASMALEKLMLDSVDLFYVERLPTGLVELVLTHLDDTVSVTNAVLKQLPNLRLLSLRLQKPRETESSDARCLESEIVCRGLRKVWWTKSAAPEGVMSLVAKSCQHLESLSLPRTATDRDIVEAVLLARYLREIWMMDCPAITENAFGALKNLRNLKYVQLDVQLSHFLSETIVFELTTFCTSLREIRLVFNDSGKEDSRRDQVLEKIQGGENYKTEINHVMSFQASNLGDKMRLDMSELRRRLVK